MLATHFQRWTYQKVAKPIFFRFDPEAVHDLVTAFGKRLGTHALTRRVCERLYRFEHPSLVQTIRGIRFENPIGLTAGFDKNAELTRIMPSVGFGFEEIGSVTGEPCEGNPKPRLWRLPKSRGLVVYYGLKNDGAETIAARLRKESLSFPVGISIAKTNNACTVDVEAGVADYVKAYRAFVGIGQYITVNVSCPNAFGGEPFTTPERLDRLLSALDQETPDKPLFLKLPVDIEPAEFDALRGIADRHRVDGFVLSNLTKRRDRPGVVAEEVHGLNRGGISGRPVFDASNILIEHAFRTCGSRYVIIGSGGVFSAEDAYEKIRRGASLVQLATGMIFEGPQLIGEINRGLAELLRKDGFTSVSQAVGTRTA
jgi:dihydroorotate dehydrogenase